MRQRSWRSTTTSGTSTSRCIIKPSVAQSDSLTQNVDTGHYAPRIQIPDQLPAAPAALRQPTQQTTTGRSRYDPAMDRPIAHDFTLIVPTLNEEGPIIRLLESVASQTLLPSEVLIVDGGSSDRTVAAASESCERLGIRFRVLDNPQRRVPNALNIGLEHTSTKYVGKVSAHSELADQYVEVMLTHLEAGREGAGGRKSARGVTAQGRANAAVLNSRIGVGGSAYHYATTVRDAPHIPSGNYSTDFLKRLGGWDENLPVSQDVELDARIVRNGGRLVLDPSTETYWSCRETLRGLFLQYRRYGCGVASVSLQDRSTFHLRHILPIGLVLSQSAIFAAGVSPQLRRLARGLGLVYPSLLFSLGTVLSGQKRLNPLRVTSALAAMQIGYGIGQIEALVGRSPAPSQMRSHDTSS